MSLFDKVKSAAQQAQSAVQGAIDNNKDSVIGSLQNASQKIQDVAHQSTQKVSQTYHQTKSQIDVVGQQIKSQADESAHKVAEWSKETKESVQLKTSQTANAAQAFSQGTLQPFAHNVGETVKETFTEKNITSVVGEKAVKLGKTVSGVQAYQDRKSALSLKEEGEQIIVEIEAESERRRVELNGTLSDLGKLRCEALQETVGVFLNYLEMMGRRNSEKEYELLRQTDISMEHIGEMRAVEMQASDALKTLAVSGGFAAVAVAGTPALVTSAVTAFAAASTGTAISTLSGAAASNAVLAWLGGGAIAAGGGGMAAGAAVLTTLTVGVTGVFAVASAGIVASAYFSKKHTQAQEDKARIDEWAAEVRKGWVLLDGIQVRALEISRLTSDLTVRAKAALQCLGEIVQVFDEQNMEHVKIFQSAALLVKSMSELAQVPLLGEDGNLSNESLQIVPKIDKVLNTSLK